ncbi:MAG: hypothetical protein QG564_524 [Campylobacterota bacterium]|nr:hypothetical protein [Campylobacterota bacterium]
MIQYDLVVVGSGPAGMTAAITAAHNGKKVLVLEKLSKIGSKLKATGGGRCNLTNTLDNEAFMECFGRDGRFMSPALEAFDHNALTAFFKEAGVETHAPDGYRVFPVTHNSSTIVDALQNEMARLGIEVLCSQKVKALMHDDGTAVTGVSTQKDMFYAKHVVLATGGKGYPILGAEGDGYALAESVGHKITELYPAMMPLKTKETWVDTCRADTIAKVEMFVNMKKYHHLRAKGDLIFTKDGIRGPSVLDFSREITPLLSKFNEVPLLMNLTKGMNEEQLLQHFKTQIANDPHRTTLQLIQTLLPESVALELCKMADADPSLPLGKQAGTARDKLLKLLAWTPLTVIGHDGFSKAMITRGGISLKEINPHTLESRKLKGLYFCGEIVNLDGPCGGYNLQWSFSSGALAGKLGT